jgi:hypothetical protein
MQIEKGDHNRRPIRAPTRNVMAPAGRLSGTQPQSPAIVIIRIMLGDVLVTTFYPYLQLTPLSTPAIIGRSCNHRRAPTPISGSIGLIPTGARFSGGRTS